MAGRTARGNARMVHGRAGAESRCALMADRAVLGGRDMVRRFRNGRYILEGGPVMAGGAA